MQGGSYATGLAGGKFSSDLERAQPKAASGDTLWMSCIGVAAVHVPYPKEFARAIIRENYPRLRTDGRSSGIERYRRGESPDCCVSCQLLRHSVCRQSTTSRRNRLLVHARQLAESIGTICLFY
jgi:hypothetical protein